MIIARALLVSVAACAAAAAFDGDTFAAKFDALPKAVKETAMAHMDQAFPVSISTAKSDKGWDYQVNTRVNGKYHDLVIDENGKLVAVKDETELAAIPAAAKTAIEKRAAASSIVTLEKVTEDGQVSYGATLKDDAEGKIVQVRVGADGSLKSKNGNESAK